MRGRWLIAVLVLMIAINSVAGARYVISNSADWHDVYSTMLYASLENVESTFLTSARHSTMLTYRIPRAADAEIVSSNENRFVVGYDTLLQGRGYDSAEEFVYDNVNLELARRLTDTTNFIVIDPSYGYNAISAAPYAVLTDSYILFVDDRNIGDVAEFLEENTVSNLVLFGQLDREVKDELAQYDPEMINEGDRFDNNIAMAEKYLEINPRKQVTLSNGEFIEEGLMSGVEPIVFIGRTNVPDQVRDFIDEQDIDVGVLVGNELIGTATFIRRQLGISVFVKFAQGSRTPSGSIAPVEDLDRFPMPYYSLNLDFESGVYNRAAQTLDLTFQNRVDLATYFKSTITIRDGDNLMVIGDDDSIFVDGNEYRTVSYSETSNGNPIVIESSNATAELFTIYGEGRKSLEYTLEVSFPIEMVTVVDNADVEIRDLVYDTRGDDFEVLIESTGGADAYVNVDIVDITVNDELMTVGSEGVDLVESGDSIWISVPVELAQEDIDANTEIMVVAYYGERELSLVKSKVRVFEYKEKAGDYITYALIVVLVAILVLFFLTKKKRCKNCGHKNKKKHTHCKKCGHRIKH